MGFEISYREHRIYANPATIVWSKPTATIFRGDSTPNLSQGRWYMFFVVDRAWLDNKYIRWRWQGAYSWSFATYAQIWDGEYDRSSMVDFPDQAGPISKGNGTLQTLDQNSGSFAMETKDVQADTSGGSEDKCTVIFWSSDAWSAQAGYFQLDWIEVNTGAGGADPISNEQFTDAIIVEQAGTTADYGYIGYGQADPISLNLFACFEVSSFSESLLGVFTVRHAGSEDLPAEFEVGQGWENLPGEFIVRHSVSVELHGAFDGQVSLNLHGQLVAQRASSEDLLGILEARHADAEDLLGEFMVRHTATPLELFGKFISRHTDSEELQGKFIARHADLQDLAAKLVIRHSRSVELPGELIVRHADSADLLAGLISRHADLQDLAAKLVIRHSRSVELPGELIVRHAGSVDLGASFDGQVSLNLSAGFWVRYYSANLLGIIYVRPSTSKATDFEVKDNTRGLTINDPDRIMTVTPRRKMKVR